MISKPYASMNLHVRLRSENVSASRSINVHLMPSSNAAIPVVPLPANGSQTLLTAKLPRMSVNRSEEHTSELQSRENLVCRLLLEKKKTCSAQGWRHRRIARLLLPLRLANAS